jgi:hypothetical protein
MAAGSGVVLFLLLAMSAWVALAFGVASLAKERDRDVVAFFLLAFLAPYLALIVVLLPDLTAEGTRRLQRKEREAYERRLASAPASERLAHAKHEQEQITRRLREIESERQSVIADAQRRGVTISTDQALIPVQELRDEDPRSAAGRKATPSRE